MKSYFSNEDKMVIKDRASSLVPGKSIHINHEGCEAGKDTKRRLYISITSDGGAVLAYCHHCGRRGFYPMPLAWYYKSSVPAVDENLLDSMNEPFTRAHTEFCSATKLGESYAASYAKLRNSPLDYLAESHSSTSTFLDQLNARDWYGIRMIGSRTSLTTQPLKLFIPISKDDFSVSALLVRNTQLGSLKWENCFKYDTPHTKEVDPPFLFDFNNNKKVVVLCEDPISAMKIDLAGFAGACLLGVNARNDELLKLSMIYDNCIVWLDNDSDVVKEAATTLFNSARPLFKYTYKTVYLSDPKRASYKKIKEIIGDLS